MSDQSDGSGDQPEINPEPPSSTGGQSNDADRQGGEGWLGRLRAAVGLKNLSFRRELEEVLESEEPNGAFSAEERTLLNNILGLREVRVEDIMVPRGDVEAIEINQSVAELIGRFRRSGHSRMPIFRESLDEPAGMVHIKDLVRFLARGGTLDETEDDEDVPLDLSGIDLTVSIDDASLVRDVLFVPPSMPVATLLSMMQTSRTQMALVIDEYGGTDGLVSLEDAVETIVGEIEDEHDEGEPEIVQEGEGIFVADARAELDDIAAAIGTNLAADEDGEVDTIAGLVFRRLGRIPAEGEAVVLEEGPRIEVLDANTRRIRRVRIVINPGPAFRSEPPENQQQSPRETNDA